ncbi:MAG: M15 family metallopeptidase [Gammaproteobacteria bacterium]|nr:M15 family metallopeptidase [Gammaproteobacteria bacterium]
MSQTKSQYYLSKRSKKRLQGVNPKLVAVITRAIEITEQDFTVLEGLRTPKRQKWLKRNGYSWTLKSKHLTGRAVDVAPWVIKNGKGTIDWNDLKKFEDIKNAIFSAAKEQDVKIRWGGDWNQNGDYRDEIRRGVYDGGHFELVGE